MANFNDQVNNYTEHKAVCKWMYEREEERKTEDSLDAKETRDAVMFVVGYNNLGMNLNYEIYDSLSSAKERFNELVSGGRYDMVLLCKKTRK